MDLRRPIARTRAVSRAARRLPAALAALLALLLPAGQPLAARQNGHARTPVIGQIRVTGNHRFSTKKIIAASGLRSGAPARQRDLEQAASRLAQSGAFSDVSYQYRARGKTWDAILQVVEVQQFAPCIFDNFVWFSDAELTAAIERAFPLFDGSMAESRGMQEAVTAAANSFLSAHGIRGSTAIRPVFDLSHNLIGFLLHVDGVPMPLKDVQVEGGPLDAAAIREVAHGILSYDYSRHTAEYWAQTALTEEYQDEGYLQPHFSGPVVAFADPTGKDVSQGVVAKFLATPGLRYHWGGVSWMGDETLSAEQLTRLMVLSTGDIAGRKETLAGWDAVRQAFGRQGYLTADVAATPVFDDHAATVHYNAQITKGPQFTMGELVVDDPSPEVVKAVNAAWKIRRGEVYTTDAEKESRQRILQAQSRMRRADKRLALHRSLNTAAHTVSVLVKFE